MRWYKKKIRINLLHVSAVVSDWIMTTAFVNQPMAWNHERTKYVSNECLSFKALWKMLILDDTIDNKATTKRKNVSDFIPK